MRLVALFLFLVSSPSWAFRLTPMVLELAPSGKGSSGTFTLENNGAEKTAIQLEMKTRMVDRLGKETQSPTSDFALFPDQMSLDPGQKRNIRVTYTGTTPTAELPYRLIASQLPLDFDAKPSAPTGKASLKFLLEYVASVYVTPGGVKAKLKLKEFKINAKKDLLLIIANEGSAHFLLTELQVKAEAKGKTYMFTDKAMEEVRSINLMPFSEREAVLSLPAEFALKEAKIEVQFQK